MNNKGNIKEVPSTSLDVREDLVRRLLSVVPEAETDGKIDWDKLKQELTGEIEESNERYDFTWNGKKDSLRLAQKPTTATLKPNKDKSKNWDTTDNIYIEGDNLEVLKILQKSYSNKIKVIYIDPPYNTGKDFVYKDNFHKPLDNYLEQTGQLDDEGNKLSANTETSGRYHTDWLNMMYPRLKLARNLLTEDGVIFISIDDSEQDNLKKIANEIFGESNFLAQIVWERAFAPINLKKNFSESHDYILVYGKNADIISTDGLKRNQETDNRYSNPDNDERGPWSSGDLSVGPAIEKNIYEVITPSGRIVSPPSGRSWLLSQDRFNEYLKDDRIWFGEKGSNTPRIKRFLSEVKTGITPMTIWKYEDVGHSQSASQYLKNLFDDKSYFTYPKPVKLIKRMIELYSEKNSIILDFFSGSSTTAEAVMIQNAEDQGNRKFIMVQLPEQIDEKEVAYKEGYRTIPEIAQERIKRAGEKLMNEDPLFTTDIDIGFKVFELNKSNIKKWNTNATNLEQQISIMENNFEEDSTPIDIVYEIMLKQGIELTYRITEDILDNMVIYNIANGAMFVILGEEIGDSINEYINKEKIDESVVIFQDQKFKDDSTKLNIIESLNSNGIKYENIFSI